MIGQQIGSYTILKKLGEGGMGAVYLAQHTRIGSRVAIKVLLPRHSDNHEVVTRFFNEARATAQIKHPGLIDVYDFGELPDGSAYLVMQWLEGESLATRIDRGPLEPTLLAEIGRQLCAAVGAAHAHGIIHRDLKPDNVFLVPDAELPHGLRIKVLDFGIAKLTNVKTSTVKTHSQMLLGSPAYMSPEQCRGAGAVDHRTDLYAIGCILYEMACGHPPFVYEGVGETINAHICETPTQPAALAPDLTAELNEIIVRCLAKRPEDRHANADELMQALAAHTGSLRLGPLRPKRKTAAPTEEDDTRFDPKLVDRIAAKAGLPSSQLFDSSLEATLPRSPRAPKLSTLGASAAESVRRPRRLRRRWWMGFAALSGVILTLALVVSHAADRPLGNRVASAMRADPPPPAPGTAVGGGPTTTMEIAPVVVTPPEVTLKVESTPTGAEVLLGPVVLGTTPLIKRLPPVEGAAELELRYRGYVSKRIHIATDRDEHRIVVLIPAEKRAH
jgi:serine/threonine-protein kinase